MGLRGERRATFATELCLEGIVKPTIRTVILEPSATLSTEGHPFGILKSAACASHGDSLLLLVRCGKEKALGSCARRGDPLCSPSLQRSRTAGRVQDSPPRTEEGTFSLERSRTYRRRPHRRDSGAGSALSSAPSGSG